MSLRHLLDRRAEIAAVMERLDAAHPNGELPEAAQTEWDAALAEKKTLDQRIQRRAILDEMTAQAPGLPLSTGDRALDTDVHKRYSWTRAIGAAAGLPLDNGFEWEVSQELSRRAGRKPGGFFAPIAALAPAETRVLTTTTPSGHAGGNLVQTTLDSAQLIQPFYADLTVRRAGARVITGLIGNLDVPKQSSSVTGYWVAENSAITASDPGFDAVSLTPKHYGALTEISRNMLLQSSPDVESILRSDMARVLAVGLDNAAIAGSGSSNQPRGILSTSGVGSVAMGATGGAITWAAALSLIEQVELANAGSDALAWIGNPRVKASAQQVLKAAGVPGFVMDSPTSMAGYPYYSTTLIPSNLTKSTGSNLSALVFGNWSDLLIGLWSEIDILVNPYSETAYTKGNILVRAMMTCDIAVRHPESFAAITDIVAA